MTRRSLATCSCHDGHSRLLMVSVGTRGVRLLHPFIEVVGAHRACWAYVGTGGG